MADTLRKQILQTLQSLLSFSEDSTRTTAAGCFGSLCTVLPDAELSEVMIDQLLGICGPGYD